MPRAIITPPKAIEASSAAKPKRTASRIAGETSGLARNAATVKATTTAISTMPNPASVRAISASNGLHVEVRRHAAPRLHGDQRHLGHRGRGERPDDQ